MAGEVIVDALPYIDQGYDDPGVRDAVFSMVEEETRRYRPTKNYLEHLPPVNLHAFEKCPKRYWNEAYNTKQVTNTDSKLKVVKDFKNFESTELQQYELPQPPAGKMSDLAAWTESVENSRLNWRNKPHELMGVYGCETWKACNTVLVQMTNQAQKQLQDLKKKILEVNWQRKSSQNTAGEKLKDLESSWVGLVSKNYEIERACAELEKEIAILEQKMEKLQKT
ncbi:pre-mRNA-splicing factor SPF27 [Trichonephila inaurata madagascariensis]|uniref:Pre-mRNA-splicing factor SPF27 n=1 Tax=Trichonephila inaurata madagascariensis TaxID=2747483 RepID=A0A8X6YUX2_9ARAC|nr:pre-mRNA-splicing factor SPF27 [Trichonephila inaurata madagascariensis]